VVNDAHRYSKVCGLLVPYCVMAGAGDPHPVDCSPASAPHLVTSRKDGASLIFINSSIHILTTFACAFLSIDLSYFSGSLLCNALSLAFHMREMFVILFGDGLSSLKFPVSPSSQSLGDCLCLVRSVG
jgi:hypothetical protein